MEGFASGAQAGAGKRFVYLNNFQFKMQASEEDQQKYPKMITTRVKKIGVNAGDEVVEMATNAIFGHIVGIQRREVNYQCDTGHEFNIDIQDSEGTIYQIALKDMARQASYILTRLPNVDLAQPIKLGVFKSELLKDGKPYPDPVYTAQLYIQQKNDQSKWVTVANAYPKGTKNGPPEFINKGVIKGKQIWDNSDQWEWLMENVALPAQGRISEIHANKPVQEPEESGFQEPQEKPKKSAKLPKSMKPAVDPRQAEPVGAEYEDDDLPF